jgi:hypothetical protein
MTDVILRTMEAQSPTFDPDALDLGGLMESLDAIATGAKSFFPGRVLLNRKKTFGLIRAIDKRLLAESKVQNVRADYGMYLRAIEAGNQVYELATSGTAGPSIWRIWFADVRRKQLAQALDELRDALAPFTAAENRRPL